MNTAKITDDVGPTLSAFATEAEGALVVAVERDFPLAAKAICDPSASEWANLPSTRAVWAEAPETFAYVDWRSDRFHWYLRVCAFELLRTDSEGGEPPAVRTFGGGGGPTGATAIGPSHENRYDVNRKPVAAADSLREENLDFAATAHR